MTIFLVIIQISKKKSMLIKAEVVKLIMDSHSIKSYAVILKNAGNYQVNMDSSPTQIV